MAAVTESDSFSEDVAEPNDDDDDTDEGALNEFGGPIIDNAEEAVDWGCWADKAALATPRWPLRLLSWGRFGYT